MQKKGLFLLMVLVLLAAFSLPGGGRIRFTVIYEVQEGDTPLEIASTFGVPLADLLRANNMNENSIIRLEDELIIPYPFQEENPVFHSQIMSPPPREFIYNLGEVNYPIRIRGREPVVDIPAEKTILYRVQPGDTLYTLARYFNTTVQVIKVLNHLEGSTIQIGQRLLLPTINLNPRQAIGRSITQREMDLLARAISGEARGEPLLGQVAVGAVILNRLFSSAFPNTIEGVIYQPNQFSAVCDGQINLIPSSSSYLAARRALEGEDPTMGALFFYNPRTAVNVAFFERVNKTIEIGNHVFGH